MGKLLASTTITDPCGGCCGSLGITWECESLTGTATLSGITGYRADEETVDDLAPEAPWQYRKWAGRAMAGTWTTQSYAAPSDCTGECSGGVRFVYSGTYYWTGPETTDSNEARYETYDGCDTYDFVSNFEPDKNGAIGRRSTAIPDVFCEDTGTITQLNASYTLTTATGFICPGTECREYGGTSTLRIDASDVSETLVDEQYFYDALLAAGDAVDGESCCTYLEEADVVPPESDDDISLTGTAVRVTITLLNSSPGVDYAVTVTLSQENPQPEDPEAPPVPPTITEVDLVINGDAPVAYYYPPLPVPEDFEICVIAVELGGEVEE